MTNDDYSVFVFSLYKNIGNQKDNLAHAAMGISGEAGELLDAIKKHWAYDKVLDVDNVIEELGDLEFYMQALRNVLGVPREHIIKLNVEKLEKRYPSKTYSNEQAIARADKSPPSPLSSPHPFSNEAQDIRELNQRLDAIERALSER